MKIYLEKAIFVNRAPFDKLELDFTENEIAILTAINGKGKTTILSHIVDLFYEMARPHFYQEFEDKQNKLYRLSSSIYNLNINEPSFVYFRLRTQEGIIDYVDVRNPCTEIQYNEALELENKIPYQKIVSNLQESNYTKIISHNFDKKKAEKIFFNNILTYFPSYRYESPGYLNTPYKIKLDFKKQSGFSGLLKNPIEVISGLPDLANWIMDIILDLWRNKKPTGNILKNNIDLIISSLLFSKKIDNVIVDVGPRNLGDQRIQIGKFIHEKGETSWKCVYPSIFNLSSGESSILCLFGELLRQADNYKNNIELSEITGIVLIDEIDKHLHIKLQKEILPLLLSLFPNVQFIVSSHSPFLSMGLAEKAYERTRIIDLDNLGISKDPTTNELYLEVYQMMVSENERFKETYQSLEQIIKKDRIPIIITEGKTDWKHLKKALDKLQASGKFIQLDIEFLEYENEVQMGFGELKTIYEKISKVPNKRKIICIFDRDVKTILKDITDDLIGYKNQGNNVFSLAIPVPSHRSNHENISIEHYYTDDELKTKNSNGWRLFFTSEFKEKSGRHILEPDVNYISPKSLKGFTTTLTSKIIESEVLDINEKNIALPKNDFAENILKSEIGFDNFDASEFAKVFNIIEEIIKI